MIRIGCFPSPGARLRAVALASSSVAIGLVLAGASVAHADELHARSELTRLLPQAASLELADVDEVALPSGDHLLRWSQRHRGLRVLGRGATLRVDANGVGLAAHAALETTLPTRSVPDVTREAAALAAERFMRVGLDGRDAELVIAPLGARGDLVWRFVPHVDGLPFSPEILVDARTGAVRRARERAVTIGPTAEMYRANPFRTPGLERLPFPIAPTRAALASDAIAAKTCVDKGAVLPFPGSRSGVRACDLVAKSEPSALGDWIARPQDDPNDPLRDEDEFAEESMFFHVGRVYSYFEHLAPPGTRHIVAGKGPFLAVANLRLAPGLQGGDPSRAADPGAPLAPYSNAFFAPGDDGFGAVYGVRTGALWFGQGPRRDYAYDGDVVYHEFTHAIVDATLGLGSYTLDEQGISAAPGALNEALADFFSSALAGDPDLGEYAADDVAPGLRYVRTLANDDRCAGRQIGEAHFDSTAFSGALWAARSSLSDIERVVFDRLLYAALLENARFDSPTFEEFAAIALEAFATRSSLAARALRRELDARGFLPGCSRIIEATDRTVMSPADEIGRLGFQAPGKLETGLSLVPGVVTFKSAVREGTLVVRFGATARESLGGLFTGEAGATAYAPTVLVRFDEPIHWHHASHDAPLSEDARADGNQWSAAFAVPAGARVAYVQIANTGDKSGVYDGVRLSFEAVTNTAAGADAGVAEDSDAPDATTADRGCATAGHVRASVPFALVALGTLAGLALRRRRRP